MLGVKNGIVMIVIYGIEEKLIPIRAKLSDVIHKCMQTVLGMPEDKRAHRFVPLDKENFYYPGGRTDAYTVIEINMMEGRKKETQKALIKALFVEIESQLGISPIDVEITIKEQPPHCWGFRGITGDEAKLNYKVKV
jgi:phenylpyruvate tautomerase PptA (4-oxalocrotonate tautomerase family)